MLHDWFCDHSVWDPVLPYLSTQTFTYVFADLRGYGASRAIDGSYTLEEAATDVIALADRIGWRRFSLIGYSMSGLVVQRILQLATDRVERVVAVTSVPPAGLGMDEPAVELFRSMALASDDDRFAALAPMWGARLSESWIRFKLRRWRETTDPLAAAGYVAMWGCTDISDAARGIPTRMLIVSAEEDAPPFRRDALHASMLPFYPNATLLSLRECGHYPMQEQPPLLATQVERFLGE